MMTMDFIYLKMDLFMIHLGITLIQKVMMTMAAIMMTTDTMFQEMNTQINTIPTTNMNAMLKKLKNLIQIFKMKKQKNHKLKSNYLKIIKKMLKDRKLMLSTLVQQSDG